MRAIARSRSYDVVQRPQAEDVVVAAGLAAKLLDAAEVEPPLRERRPRARETRLVRIDAGVADVPPRARAGRGGRGRAARRTRRRARGRATPRRGRGSRLPARKRRPVDQSARAARSRVRCTHGSQTGSGSTRRIPSVMSSSTPAGARSTNRWLHASFVRASSSGGEVAGVGGVVDQLVALDEPELASRVDVGALRVGAARVGVRPSTPPSRPVRTKLNEFARVSSLGRAAARTRPATLPRQQASGGARGEGRRRWRDAHLRGRERRAAQPLPHQQRPRRIVVPFRQRRGGASERRIRRVASGSTAMTICVGASRCASANAATSDARSSSGRARVDSATSTSHAAPASSIHARAASSACA